jgi:competence protein ComGC
MTNVPAHKQLGFTIVCMMIVLISRILLSGVFAIFAGLFKF